MKLAPLLAILLATFAGCFADPTAIGLESERGATAQTGESSALTGATALSASETEARGLVGLVAVLDGERRGFCSGTLVADRWIITAAHCQKTPRGAVAHAVFAIDIFGAARETIAITAFRRHPTADLALVELAKPAPTRYARMAIMPKRTTTRTGRSLELAGFGRRDSASPASSGNADNLIAVATLADPSSPLISMNSIRSGACFGDSGGPVYVTGAGASAGASAGTGGRVVLGVLSGGNPSCRGGDNYVSVGFYEPFLRATVKELRFIDPDAR